MPNVPHAPVVHSELEAFVWILHERGTLRREALLAVLKDLVDDKPLTLYALASIFGVEAVNAAFYEETRRS